MCIENTNENCTLVEGTNCLQNYSKRFLKVNILSPIETSTLKVKATFVFSNNSNFMDVPLQLVLGICHHSDEIVRTIVKMENTRKTAKLLKYRVIDGNKEKCWVEGSLNLYPEIFPTSRKISIMMHINMLPQKVVVIANLINMQETKLIHHSATVNLSKSFDYLDKDLDFFVLRTNISSTHHIEIDEIVHKPNSTG